MNTQFLRPWYTCVLMLVTACLLAACGPSNNVRLFYNSATPSILPQPQAPRVVVVMFEDQRLNPQVLGPRRDGSSFTANTSVTDWVSRSLADELARQGVQVSFANTISQAQAGNPNYVVTGVVREIVLKETGPTSASAAMKISVTLRNRSGIVYSENLTSSQEKPFLPSSSAVENLLAETLRELMSPTAKKMQSMMN